MKKIINNSKQVIEAHTSIIPMAFHTPIGVRIFWIILFVTANFDLLETPLRKNGIQGTQITPQVFVLDPQTSGE